jgi:hypothetical protein
MKPSMFLFVAVDRSAFVDALARAMLGKALS